MHNGNGDGQRSVPFLEIITRHMAGRPTFLAANQASLAAQTSDDWQQTLLVDDVGRGMAWAQEQLASFKPHGEYVWILDDDDVCIRPTLVAELKAIAVSDDGAAPIDVIMLRMDHGPMGVKPENVMWQRFPHCGHVGCSAFVVRREVWKAHAAHFAPGTYVSDYRFIAAVFESEPRIHWHDVIGSRVQRISQGATE